jgi:hypothetical protein
MSHLDQIVTEKCTETAERIRIVHETPAAKTTDHSNACSGDFSMRKLMAVKLDEYSRCTW